MNDHRRLPLVFQALPYVLAVVVLSITFVVAHSDSVRNTQANRAAIVTARATTHRGFTNVIGAVGLAVVSPQDGRRPTAGEVAGARKFAAELQAAADMDYQKCLEGANR